MAAATAAAEASKPKVEKVVEQSEVNLKEKKEKGKGDTKGFPPPPTVDELFPKGVAFPTGIYDTPLPSSHRSSSSSSSSPSSSSSDETVSTKPKPSPRTTLFSSSLIPQSNSSTHETALIFPDWKVVTEIENSKEGAEELMDLLDGDDQKAKEKEKREEKTWTLPYRAVILLCEFTLCFFLVLNRRTAVMGRKLLAGLMG